MRVVIAVNAIPMSKAERIRDRTNTTGTAEIRSKRHH
jgi:hypothetical protein